MLLDHVILNENAYFYKTVEGFTLSRTKIEGIFTEISRERIGNYTLKIVKKVEALGAYSIYYSFCIFKFNKRPSFLEKDVDEVFETKYAYLLIMEYLDFIVVIRKNIGNLSTLLNNDSLEQLDYITISRIYINDRTRFERLSMKNMDIANTAVRNKVIEANNVKDSISNLGANKYIVNNMRISNPEGTKSISFGTSRISDISEKVKIIPILHWSANVVNKAKAFSGNASFLDVFAMPVDFEEYISGLTPASILFPLSEIKYDIEIGKIDRITYIYEDIEKEIQLGPFLKALSNFDNYCNLEHDEDQSGYEVIADFDDSLRLKVNTKSITISSDRLSNIVLHLGEKRTDIVKYINSKNNFLVSFDKIDYIYFSRKLFKDNKLLTSINNLLTTFTPSAGLTSTISEKGNLTENSTSFEQNSIFNFIETELAQASSFLVCDDLGNEWADFISIQDNTINIYHAKSNNKERHTLSASKFHDVVGQALKNSGNVVPADHQWEAKRSKWTELYSNTNISRMRRGSAQELIDNYKELVFKPNIRKRIHLVVDFISKSELSDNLARLARHESVPRKNELIQILWFISSLISSCTELGYEVYIICQP